MTSLEKQIFYLIFEVLEHLNFVVDGLQEPYQRRGDSFKEIDNKLQKMKKTLIRLNKTKK